MIVFTEQSCYKLDLKAILIGRNFEWKGVDDS